MSGSDDHKKGRRLQPHSSAWFEDALSASPIRAITSGHVIGATGCTDVCGVCGDRPARDYDDAEPPFRSVRLCDDCRDIQTLGFGARLAPRADPSADAD